MLLSDVVTVSRRAGFVNRELTRVVERNNEETGGKILDTIERWYRWYGVPDHLVARLSGESLAYIITIHRSRNIHTDITPTELFPLSSSQEFSTLEDAVKFDQECLIAIGLRTKEDTPTLLDDASAATAHEVDETVPPSETEDHNVEPPIVPTPLRRSERLMRKKAKAVAEVAAPAAESVPLKKKTGLSAPSRRSTRARRKPTRFSP